MASGSFSSGLSRGWTPSLLSNKIAMGGWVVSLGVFAVVAATTSRMTYVEAASSSIVVFLGWAIGRELDPDHPWVGAMTMVGTFAAVFVEVPTAWTVGAALLTLRIVVGSTGRWLAPFDLPFAAVIGYGSGGELWAWPIAIVAFVAIGVYPEFTRYRWSFISVGVVAFAGAWYVGELEPINVTTEQVVVAAVVTVIALIGVALAKSGSETDRPGGLIAVRRVRMARSSAWLFSVWAVLIGGTAPFWSIAAIPAGLAGVMLWNVGAFAARLGSS